MEVTKWLKPSECVSRNGDSASVQAVTRVNAEQASKMLVVNADPLPEWGRPWSMSPRTTGCMGFTGVMATACWYQDIGRNTGDLRRWVRDPTGRPRGTGRAGEGGGQARSTDEAG